MASNIRVGQLLRITVRFADFDYSTGTDELLDPTAVTLDLYKYNSATSSYDYVSALGPVTQESLGIYYYDWLTPEDGKFKLIFTGSVPAATPSAITDTRVFYVGTSTPTVVLSGDLEFYFLGELTPLYLDPQEIKAYYEDVDLVEATEIIYKLSLELDEWFGSSYEITSLMEEYLIAATLCQLSRIYVFDGGLSGFGTTGSFQLGELKIDKNNSASASLNKNGLGLGQASNWCEIAAILKNQLTSKSNNLRSVVRSLDQDNPIPKRQIRGFD